MIIASQFALVASTIAMSAWVFASDRCEGVLKESKNVPSVEFLYKPGRSIFDVHEFVLLLGELKKDPLLAEMLKGFNEKEKGLRIEDHVIDVFNQYLKEKKRYVLNPLLIDILPITIALHDIGKPLAIQNGNRDSQHLYTIPMLETLLKKHHFSRRQIETSKALIMYTGFGDLAKNQKNSFEVAKDIYQISESLGLSSRDFYIAKKLFYTADAGAYSQLRKHIFNELEDGSLDLKTGRFFELEYWLTGEI